MQKSSTNQDGGQPERSIWGHRVNEASLLLSARRELKVTQTNISTFIKAGLGAASRHVWVVVRFGNKTSLRLNNQMIWCVCHLECETRLCVHFFSHNDSLCCLIVSHHPLLLGLVLSVPLLCHSSVCFCFLRRKRPTNEEIWWKRTHNTTVFHATTPTSWTTGPGVCSGLFSRWTDGVDHYPAAYRCHLSGPERLRI